jgi:chemotaxis protein CheD
MTDEVAVGMGQSALAREPTRLTTILGSCVAVTLYSPRRRQGMLSHVVLPQSKGSTSNPAKFADTAVPHMLSALKSQGVEPREITAKLVGGACMFGKGICAQIGESNIQAVVQALEAAGIRIAGRDVGGYSGRRICFDPATGCITVTSAGHPSRTI